MPKPAHIIIIDDDSLIRLLVSKALAVLGLETSQTSSGEQGLHLFTERGADAILLDVMMPNGLDGYSTCQEFRKLPDGLYIPILMMTGLEDIEAINRAFEVGATDFITKPINTHLLGHRIRYMLKASQTTKRLLDSEERWKFALEGAGDCVWDWDPQTDLIKFSSRWMEIIGCAAEQIPLSGNQWLESCHPDDKATVLAKMKAYLHGELPSFGAEFRMQATNKTWKWIFARGKIVKRDQQGLPIRLIGTLTDISEHKTLQAQLIQAQKLESIGQMAAGIAHEINTPIQYIGDNLNALAENFISLNAYQQALLLSADVQQGEQIQALVKKFDLEFILEDSPAAIAGALEGVSRVAEIVKAMNTFSHVESSKCMQTINLHDTINSALIITRNRYKLIALVETHFSSQVGKLKCYVAELNQVLLNLIINAVHAIEEKHIETGLIRISTYKHPDTIEIEIADNGVGIPEAIQDKVFNLFFTTKPVGKGTGQGLSLAHSIIVEKHHGKLYFESSVGLGTTFHIHLPIN
jgi:PAS domain S-box-containing protein